MLNLLILHSSFFSVSMPRCRVHMSLEVCLPLQIPCVIPPMRWLLSPRFCSSKAQPVWHWSCVHMPHICIDFLWPRQMGIYLSNSYTQNISLSVPLLRILLRFVFTCCFRSRTVNIVEVAIIALFWRSLRYFAFLLTADVVVPGLYAPFPLL